jgi:16S rRNA (guanine527-N7)-methyltransferase
MAGLGHGFSTRARDLFDLQLEAPVLEKLEHFLDLLTVWAKKTNLISVASRQEIIDRHLLDSLAPAPLLHGVHELADFGSGAGFPGIPLSVLKPETRVHLVESRRRRANFLRHAVRSLGLKNVLVYELRAEEWHPERGLEAVVGRALRVDALAKLAAGVLAPTGSLVVMRKADDERRVIPGFVHEATVSYSLPGGRRHEAARYRHIVG